MQLYLFGNCMNIKKKISKLSSYITECLIYKVVIVREQIIYNTLALPYSWYLFTKIQFVIDAIILYIIFEFIQ